MNKQNNEFPKKISKLNKNREGNMISSDLIKKTKEDKFMNDNDNGILAMNKIQKASSLPGLNTLQGQIYDPTKVLLFKGVPYDSSEIDVINLVRKFGIILDIYLVKHKQYAFVHFKEFRSAIDCFNEYSLKKPQIKKNFVHVFFTGKNCIIKQKALLSPPSRFLLFVFRKEIINVDKRFICELLAPYGNCNQVHLIQKKILQAIVEMEDIGQALHAQEKLNGAMLNGKTIIDILFTDEQDFMELYNQVHNHQGDSHHYYSLQSLTFHQTENILSNNDQYQLSNNDIAIEQSGYYSHCDDNMIYNPKKEQQPNSTQAYPINLISNGTNNNNLSSFDNQNEWMGNTCISHNNSINDNTNNSSYDSFENNPDALLVKNLTKKELYIPPGFSTTSTTAITNNNQGLCEISNNNHNNNNNIDNPISIPLSLPKSKSKKVENMVYVQNIPAKMFPSSLFNLFGMYGNVQKIRILNKSPEIALIEYEDDYQARMAKHYLNNCPIYSNNSKILVSQELPPSLPFTDLKDNDNDLVIDYKDSKDHRYKIIGSKNYKNIVGPSKVLHLSNLCDDKDEYYYAKLFNDHGKIVKMHELKGESKMYLTEMKNVTDSVLILMNFHNYNIDGKYLKVSFSRYQKIK